jgi:hypothetical protein
MKTAI